MDDVRTLREGCGGDFQHKRCKKRWLLGVNCADILATCRRNSGLIHRVVDIVIEFRFNCVSIENLSFLA